MLILIYIYIYEKNHFTSLVCSSAFLHTPDPCLLPRFWHGWLMLQWIVPTNALTTESYALSLLP